MILYFFSHWLLHLLDLLSSLLGLIYLLFLLLVFFCELLVGCLDLFLILLIFLYNWRLIIIQMVIIRFLLLLLLNWLFVINHCILVNIILILVVNCIRVIVILSVSVFIILPKLLIWNRILLVLILVVIWIIVKFLFLLFVFQSKFFIDLVCQGLGNFILNTIFFFDDPCYSTLRINFNDIIFLFCHILLFLLDKLYPTSGSFVVSLLFLINTEFHVIKHMWFPTRMLERFKLFYLNAFLVRSHDHYRDLCIRHWSVLSSGHYTMLYSKHEYVWHLI